MVRRARGAKVGTQEDSRRRIRRILALFTIALAVIAASYWTYRWVMPALGPDRDPGAAPAVRWRMAARTLQRAASPRLAGWGSG